MNITTTSLTIGFLAAAMAAGCSSNREPAPEAEMDQPFFQDEKAERSVSRILRTQRARGEAADGMLNASHFDGADLNSLGRQKLDGIIAGTPDSVAVGVYLNLPAEDEGAAAREEAVVAYLGERGLEADRIQVTAGPNASSAHLASIGATTAYERKDGTIRAAAPQLTDDSGSVSGDKGMQPQLGQK